MEEDYSEDLDNYYSDYDTEDFSCYYCGKTEKKNLLKCVATGCDQYFCNDISQSTPGSHIFNHLDLRSHNKIEFPNHFEVICLVCKETTNVFSLSYNFEGDKLSIICRNKCLIDNSSFRIVNWRGIISEKCVDNALISSIISPTNLTIQDMLKLEMKLSDGEMKNPLNIGPESYNKILLKYKNHEEYKEIFEKLLELEHEYDQYYSTQESRQEVSPVWSEDFKSFSFDFTEERCLFNVKDEVIITADGFKADGNVENISNAGTVFVCLLKGKSGSNELKKIVIKPVYSDIAYERMKRGLKSFKTLQENIKNVILGYEVTLPPFDDPDISEFSVKNLPKLNVFQNDAVRKALTSSLTLIQGPPGTGKTVTTASIVYHLSKQLNKPSQYDLTIKKIEELESQINDILNKKFALKQEIKLRETLMIRILEKEQNNENLKNRLENYVSELNKALDSYTKEAENLNEKLNQSQFKLKNLKPDDSKKFILVCAPSNVAVDHLTEKIHKSGLKVIRMYSKSKEEQKSDLSFLSFHNIFLENLDHENNFELKKLFLQKKFGNLDSVFRKKYRILEEKLRDVILKDVDVICSTCIGAFDDRLRNLRFAKVVIDEACQAQEPETLLPLLSKPDQIILVGDHFQLGPIIKCKLAEKAGLENSLFRRLIDLGHKPYMLGIQYRMHPSISAFPSFTFYNNLLQNGVTEDQRYDVNSSFDWPTLSPLFFYHIDAHEDHSSTGKSYLNIAEAEAVLKIVRKLGNKAQIGIITFYDAQRATISKYMKELEEYQYDIEIASVDSFQGREKDYIILSCVRSNVSTGVGFLGNYRRLNVAITRAKYGLIICGNGETLARSPVWNCLLEFYQKSNLVYTGELEALHPIELSLRDTSFYNFDTMFPYAQKMNPVKDSKKPENNLSLE